MSFMYNPFPYDDPRPVNRPQIPAEVVESVVCGSLNSAKSLAARVESLRIANPGKSVILAFDGYATAEWQDMINLLSQQLAGKGILLEQKNYLDNLKEEEEINNMIDPLLEWDREKDPTLLYGKIFRGGYEALLDPDKTEAFRSELRKIREGNEGKVVVVYGNGCLIPANMQLFDLKLYFDVTPKESILRIRRGQYVNLGQKEARPANQIIRRCYYADFEMAVNLRRSLLRECALDYYVPSDKPGNLQLVPMSSLKEIFTSMASYPFRAKPVYLEGVWGGTYVKKLRNLPADMRNCAWVFDLIPMEVSIVVEVGRNKVEFPFQTFFMTASEEVMGKKCADKFGGYFPIRFNYDDSYHSTGNMSVQCHSDEKYNRENFDELGRQDESYYVVEAGHDAKTFIGFRDDADVDQFIKEIKIADKEYKPVDYMKYISYEESRPGLQVMIPAGTVHSSGRNQVVLEIGSLTIGSYTYKLYDYLRPDLDGVPRPIHTYHGERTVARDRTTTWVRNNIVQKPRIARSGEGWSEVIVGESPLLYFSLRRFEFEKEIEDNTNGKFHVLTLVDGEKIRIRSKQHPERYFDAEFMDMVVVPSTIGEYVVENLGVEPIRVHKTMLKDGFENE